MKIENEPKNYKKGDHICYSCQYHVIFCTKFRRKLLNDDIKTDFLNILNNVSVDMDFNVIAVEVMQDHVHILIDINPKYNITSIIKQIKGRSSKILRDKYPELKSRVPSLWTNSKFISTVGSVDLEHIKRYIEEQKNV